MNDLEVVNPQNDVYSGWDAPKPDLPAPTKNIGNPRWPRGPQPHKRTAWPRNKDTKYMSSNSDGDGGVTFKSNSSGEPDYDIKKLIDWKGDWLPAPGSWSARKGHTNRQFSQWIGDWMNAQPADCSLPVSRPPDTFNDGGGIRKELVPHGYASQLRHLTVVGQTVARKENDEPDKGPSPWVDTVVLLKNFVHFTCKNLGLIDMLPFSADDSMQSITMTRIGYDVDSNTREDRVAAG